MTAQIGHDDWDDNAHWLASLDILLADEWRSEEDCAAYDGLVIARADGQAGEDQVSSP